jgi:uncharacterized protein (TIGR02001 family)
MRTSIKTALLSASAALLAMTSAPAFAQEEETEGSGSGITISGTAGVFSEYRFRGIGFTDGDISIQGSITAKHDSGFYVGTWGSNLEEGTTVPNFGSIELDIYGGWSGEIASGLTTDVGLIYYAYPNSTDGFDTEYLEAKASLTQTIGPVAATAGVNYAFDNGALAGDNFYVFGGLSAGIPSTPVTVKGTLGYTDGSLAAVGSGGDYLDWLVGVDVALHKNLTLSGQYIDTDAPSINNVTDSTFLVSLNASF